MNTHTINLERIDNNSFLVRLGLFAISIVIALYFSLFIGNSAYAGSDGSMSAGTDTAGPGAATQTPEQQAGPRPSNYSNGWKNDPYAAKVYTAPCTSWSGSGSWKIGSACNSDRNTVISSSGSGTQTGKGYLQFGINGYKAYFDGVGVTPDFNVSCAPSGQKSAYAQTWSRTITPAYTQTYTSYLRGSNWAMRAGPIVLSGEGVLYKYLGCVYPKDASSSVKCFWNYGGNEYYSFDRKKASGAWTFVMNRPSLGSDPGVPSGGSGTTAPNCARTGTASVQFNDNPDLLGYYRMYVSYSYKTYSNLKWVTSSGSVLYSTWSSGSTLKGSATTWWTYSCQAGSTNSTQGPYSSQASIPNVDSHLNPATCPQVNWQCKLGSPTIVGLDKTAVSNGTLSPTSPVSVLRNGEKVPLTFSLVKIVDTSTASDIDVTNGGTSPGVRNVTSIKYINLVKAGSTPFVGTDPNASNQYFKLYKNSSTTATEKFKTWYDKANTNIDKPIAFYWASDSASAPFAVQRQWKVTAEFLVPQGGSMGGGGSPADVGMKWKVGTYDCKDYAGRGTSRVDKGILTATSNPVQVVRSAGSGK